MNFLTKPISRALLAVLTMASMACGQAADAKDGQKQTAPASTTNAAKDDNAAAAKPDKVTVYYFHGTRRCPTCLGIQKNISETIAEKFKQAMEAGMLVFEELNIEEAEGKPYVEQFQLSFSTMIVAAQAGNKTVKWMNADKVWEYAHNPTALRSYVEESVNTYLKMVTE